MICTVLLFSFLRFEGVAQKEVIFFSRFYYNLIAFFDLDFSKLRILTIVKICFELNIPKNYIY